MVRGTRRGVAATNQTVAAIATLASFLGADASWSRPSCASGFAIARPQWVPRRWMVVALLVEPVLITLVAADEPLAPAGVPRGGRARS